MRDDGGGKLCRGQHAGFDMHVAVAKARDQELSCRVNDFSLRPDAMAGIRAHIGKATLGHGNLPGRQNFAALHIDQSSAPDDQISGRAPGSHGHQTRSTIGPGQQRSVFHMA